jgi:short-subunit dehydrogenase
MTTSKVILITGASRGIGAVTAQRLQVEGHQVFGTSRTPSEALPYPLLPLEVNDADSVQACVEAVIHRAGRLDVLVNNAGYDLYAAAEDTSWAEMTAQIDINFYGAVRMIQAVLPQMRQQGGGQIINLSSLGGLVSLPYNSAYAASKFALEGYSESLRYELLPADIYVSLVEPGQVRTDTLHESIRSTAIRHSVYGVAPEAIAARARQVGMTAHLEPAQVAQTIGRIVRTPRPGLRYPVGGQVRLVNGLRRWLPEGLFEAVIVSQFVQPWFKARMS